MPTLDGTPAPLKSSPPIEAPRPSYKVIKMPKVFNKKHGSPSGSVYVGRPTKWGNPYTHIKGKYSRATHVVDTVDEAISKYEEYLKGNSELMRSLPELKGENLVCWCAPGPCHADVLLRLANKEDSDESEADTDSGDRR